MRIIKDGSISGFLPSTKAFAVHYPGYPPTVSRALETLCGTEGIIKARSLQSNKLELHFRPEDPYSHPALGELRHCYKYLLKISKKKDGDELRDESVEISQQASQPETEEFDENLFGDVVAEVSEEYHFNGMVDYQHVVAVHADVARRKKRNWDDMEPQFEKRSLIDVDQEDLMILVPPLFSPKDIPESVVLKPPAGVSVKKKQSGVIHHRWEMEIDPSLAIDFYIKEVPKQVEWEKYIAQGSEQWEWQKAVSELFDERSIWVKDSVSERLLDKGLVFGGIMLRRLLYRVAYYFSNGPFRRFWIKKGYDPRKDPESRIYQMIDFRVPLALRSDWGDNAGLKLRWDDICAFRVFPYKFQISLQLYELADDYIQQQIIKPSNQTTCTYATGWFSSHELETLRLSVAVRFLSVYPKDGADSLRKSVTGRLEKSKRLQPFAKGPKLDEQGQQQVNKEVLANEEREPNDEESNDDEANEEKELNDDEEEDELDDENIDEEFDAYETFGLGGEDGNLYPESSTYTDCENISRNYLQDLFGSFPLSESGGPEQENSDGEFQIYDHYSDGNYSDDDA